MTGLPTVADALALAAGSSGMLAAAVLFVVGADAAAAAVQRKALAPSLPWADALVRAAQDEARALVPSGAAATVGSRPADHERQAIRTAALVGGLAIAVAGAIWLVVSGHVPTTPIPLVAGVIAIGAAAALAIRGLTSPRSRSLIARHGMRLAASSAFVEASSAAALLVSLAVVAHTEGLSALSFVEAAAIAVCTGLAVRLGPLPRGLVTADLVFLVPLTWIGVPLHVGLAAVIVWRLGSLLAVAGALLVTRATVPTTHHRDRARLVHRTAFATLSALPPGLRHRARTLAFDAVFSHSEDPWRYGGSTYEVRKRERLVDAVGSEPRCVVEVGCANGHNLEALAHRLPGASVIGTDVSPRALAAARSRVGHVPNVRVVDAGSGSLAETLPDGQPVDCIVLSEVLYYLGSASAVRAALEPTMAHAGPGCRVVMVHGSADASQLHDRAVRVLGLVDARDEVVDDPERPFIVTVARTSGASPLRSIDVRPARRGDAPFMAELHLREFPHSLYARMGSAFLAAMYRQWMGARGSFAAVAWLEGEPVGYAVGRHPAYRRRGRDLAASSLIGLAALAVRPTLWSRASVFYARRLRRWLGGQPAPVASELTFIAVAPEQRGRGIGSALLRSFEASVREQGAPRCTLVTEEDNAVARAFYARRGWHEVASTRSADGRPLVRIETAAEPA